MRVPTGQQRGNDAARFHHKEEKGIKCAQRRNIQKERLYYDAGFVCSELDSQKGNSLQRQPRSRKWSLQCADYAIVK